MGHMCRKCSGISAALLLIVGVLFLLRDLAVWDFWNIQGWTVLFLLLGVSMYGCRKCSDCQALAGTARKK